MSEPLHIEVSALAATHIRAAESWWRLNRPKAPNAIREELERASSLIAVQPQVGRVLGTSRDPVYVDCTLRGFATISTTASQKHPDNSNSGLLARKPWRQPSNLKSRPRRQRAITI